MTTSALLRRQLAGEIDSFRTRYDAYVKKYTPRLPGFTAAGFDLLPKVVLLPGLGAVCAGPDLEMARIARDITEQTLIVKRTIDETGGTYLGLRKIISSTWNSGCFSGQRLPVNDRCRCGAAWPSSPGRPGRSDRASAMNCSGRAAMLP